MKNKCGIVQDLLPMYIDGVASEDSQALVEEHLEGCPGCRGVYAQMKDALPEDRRAEDVQAFERAARRIRKRRKRRNILRVGAGLLAGLIVMFAVMSALTALEVPVEHGAYETSLVRTKAGVVYLNFYSEKYVTGMSGSAREEGYVYALRRKLLSGDRPEGRRYAMHTAVGYWEEGHLVSQSGEVLSSIQVEDQPGNTRVIFADGDEIPYCSQELERYCELQQQYDIQRAGGSGRMGMLRLEELEALDALWEELAALRRRVPEWQ